jgi:NADH-quinone oxidoreductase subunit G
MATIFIDGKPFEVSDGQNVLHVCLSLGFNLPYFCWHPALGSVGACRQCAVKQFKDEKDTKGKIVMACMTPAAPNTRVSIEDPEARQFRASVIEWLMVNHPHDCPVCDEGSECHLQDMTVMTGHDYREFRFLKRTHRNQYLGPLVNHEMNRCIACYRCVRFYRDYAGGRDFDVFGPHDHVYFGRHTDGVLESEFSGNLVEVCPTGVFTDKTLKRHYTRKWDLQTAPSVCVHCSVGCNTIPGERYGLLRRIRNRYHHEVNGYFLCDRGRYGYEFVNSEQRVRQPLWREQRPGPLQPSSREGALQHLAPLLAERSKVIGIGSPRASLEDNFALRTLVGPERFYQGVSAREAQLLRSMVEILQQGPARSPSLREVGLADAVLVLGEDLTNVAPMMALALRQSVRQQPMKLAAKFRVPLWSDYPVREIIQDKKGPCYLATPTATRLDDIATKAHHVAPDDLARLGFAVAQALDAHAPPVPDLPPDALALAREIAEALKTAERPLVASGPNCGSLALLQAAANVAWALCRSGHPAGLSFTAPECNSLGLSLMGGEPLEAVAKAVESGRAEVVVVLENDLFRRAEASVVNTILGRARHVIVLEHLVNATTAKADVVLPAATFAETSGTLVNNEGRAQRFYEVFVPAGEIQPGWCWLGQMAGSPWQNLDELTTAMVNALPVFKPIAEIAPPANFRIAGQRIAREPHRYSGRTAMHANVTVHEPKPPPDPDSPLAYTMEGFHGVPPSPLTPRFWRPGWNSVQAVNKFQQEVAGPLKGGEPGRRLLEPASTPEANYFVEIPRAFQRRANEWLVLPVYHLFGSEELSMLSPGVAELAPKPYLGMNAQDAATLQLQEGAPVLLTINGETQQLPARILAGLPSGLAALPAGVVALPAGLPTSGKIMKGGAS